MFDKLTTYLLVGLMFFALLESILNITNHTQAVASCGMFWGIYAFLKIERLEKEVETLKKEKSSA